MDFRLKVFNSVCETLSFTKASKLLYVSQPAVTKHINELEKHFSKQLFTRHGNTITITVEGKLLYSHSSEIIKKYDALERDFLELNDTFPEKIILGASTTISQYILPKYLSKLKSKYHNTTFTLLNENSENIIPIPMILAKRCRVSAEFLEG